MTRTGGLAIAGSMEQRSPSDRAGDPAGFTRLYRRHGRSLYGTALRMLGRPEEAEDAMQETFLKLYRKPPDIPEARLEPWLKRVLVNDCLDRLRRRARRPEDELQEETVPRPPRPGGLVLDLERAIDKLPDRAKQVFLLHDVEGFKHTEVAQMLGVSEGASKSQLFRARGILRDFISSTPGGVS